jgi:diadenylate cyclase
VLERETRLDDLIEAGVRLEALPTKELLTAIFLPYSPLHDGAVVVRAGRISAAGCILPLALRGNLPGALGTRHRAAWGIAEETDALAIAVSEETGKIALVCGGEMYEDLDGPELRQALLHLTGVTRRAEGLRVTGPAVSAESSG